MDLLLEKPRILLRIEGAAELAVSLILYSHLGGSWWFFILLFLGPDLSITAYLAGARKGASVYNLMHTVTAPGILALWGLFAHRTSIETLSLIWFAHIALDRLLGYGLKYPTRFRDTHLQHI